MLHKIAAHLLFFNNVCTFRAPLKESFYNATFYAYLLFCNSLKFV